MVLILSHCKVKGHFLQVWLNPPNNVGKLIFENAKVTSAIYDVSELHKKLLIKNMQFVHHLA